MVVKKQWKFCSISVGHFQAKRTNDILFFKAFIVHTKKICLKKGVDILSLFQHAPKNKQFTYHHDAPNISVDNHPQLSD